MWQFLVILIIPLQTMCCLWSCLFYHRHHLCGAVGAWAPTNFQWRGRPPPKEILLCSAHMLWGVHTSARFRDMRKWCQHTRDVPMPQACTPRWRWHTPGIHCHGGKVVCLIYIIPFLQRVSSLPVWSSHQTFVGVCVCLVQGYPVSILAPWGFEPAFPRVPVQHFVAPHWLSCVSMQNEDKCYV